MNYQEDIKQKQHWIFRVGDGINFNKSKYPFWGVKRGRANAIKSIVNKIKKGDILWFLTNKKNDNKIIGMAEFIEYYDRNDEPLININTFSNKEQGWDGDDNWDLQIHFTNFYETKKQNLQICIQCASVIINYNNLKDKIKINLEKHYINYRFYAEVSKRFI